jgi:hypothetical protein
MVDGYHFLLGVVAATTCFLFPVCFIFFSAFGQISCLFGHVLPSTMRAFLYTADWIYGCDFLGFITASCLMSERALVCCGSS